MFLLMAFTCTFCLHCKVAVEKGMVLWMTAFPVSAVQPPASGCTGILMYQYWRAHMCALFLFFMPDLTDSIHVHLSRPASSRMLLDSCTSKRPDTLFYWTLSTGKLRRGSILEDIWTTRRLTLGLLSWHFTGAVDRVDRPGLNWYIFLRFSLAVSA